jgi:trk system potassium uptake protein TrkA
VKKQYAVIGLGRFGNSVAKSLTGLGFEVLAIDESEQRIQEASNFVTHAVQANSTDEEALRALGIRNFDVVIVAIGQDIQASILTTLILKEIGVPTLIVKAQNELHGKVLSRIGADKVVFPERDMGVRVAHHLVASNIIDYIELSEEYSIVELRASKAIVGKNLMQLDIRARYRCNVMAIKSDGKMNITPNADDMIGENDVLVVVGKNDDLNRFELQFSE